MKVYEVEEFQAWQEEHVLPVDGWPFEPGKAELVAGRGARREFTGLELGSEVQVRHHQWTVVGVFEAGRSAYESELWVDLPMARSAFRRETPTRTWTQRGSWRGVRSTPSKSAPGHPVAAQDIRPACPSLGRDGNDQGIGIGGRIAFMP